jgi:tRNA(fMet)-specific endonuclease VapC
MTKYLLDTDHVTLHERGNIPLLHRLEKIAPTDVAVSAVTVEESLRGRLAILSRRLEGPARIHAYDKFIESVRFFERSRSSDLTRVAKTTSGSSVRSSLGLALRI